MAEMNGVTTERSHFLIVPSDVAQRTAMEKIEKACAATLTGTYRLRLNPGYTSTIACVYVESLVRELVRLMRENHGDAQINFLDLFTVVSDNRENEDADKDGNINVRFIPGPVIDSIMDRNYHPDIEPAMWEQSPVIMEVQKECGHILSTKHRFTSSSNHFYTIIAYCFLVYLFRTLKLMVQMTHEHGQDSAMINFLEMFECHCNMVEVQNPENEELVHQEFKVKILPGFQSKLIIKDDNVTELDDEE